MLWIRRFAERSKQPLINSDPGQEGETKVVWPRFKAFWFSKDTPTGHSERKKEEMDRRRGGKTISKSG